MSKSPGGIMMSMAREGGIMHSSTWNVELFLFEQGTHTRAEAVLHTGAGTELRHSGIARRNPADRDVPEIGEELAVCRALTGLAHDLLDATIADVQANNPGGATPVIAQEPELLI
jgi:hypothetical protein